MEMRRCGDGSEARRKWAPFGQRQQCGGARRGENFDSLPKSYRSCRVGYVLRNDKLGARRFAEFMQFDADTVEALGIPRSSYVVKVNNRKVLDGVRESIGLGGEANTVRAGHATPIDDRDLFLKPSDRIPTHSNSSVKGLTVMRAACPPRGPTLRGRAREIIEEFRQVPRKQDRPRSLSISAQRLARKNERARLEPAQKRIESQLHRRRTQRSDPDAA